ncbi:MAG: M60 family metallopeptidase [Sphingobacterium sp.]|jgi:hypothetical protein|nr:M60 family metallopeptidase [Sphingobacterium sp.]
MKRILKFVGVLALLSSAVSCTKHYGYNFDNGFEINNIGDTLGLNVNRDPKFIDRSKYTQARIFPGLVDDKEPRLQNYKVMVDLNYVQVKGSDLRISVAPGNWQSTSMYAPAGELVVIDVPEGIYGLYAQIGSQTTTGSEGIPVPQRDLTIYSRQVLFPGKNYLRNLYGGLIYILPSAPLGRQVELAFSGVAKAPSFKLGVTDPLAWADEIKKSAVPWFELEGNRIVFTMETAKAQKYGVSNPKELMEAWDKAIKEGYWDWTGLVEGSTDPKHRAPFNKWRIVHDVLFKDGVAQYSGFPVYARNNESYFRQATDIEGVKNTNWGTYHELGHNMQMGSTWSFAGNGEVTNNLFHFKVSRVFGHQSYKIAEVWSAAVPYIAEAKSKTGGINWASMDVDGNKYKNKSNDIRLMMWAQILERYGYDFMTYIYKRGRDARFTSVNDQSKVDFFYEALSEFTKVDMEPYLNQWGLYISTVSKQYISQTKAFPLLDRDVWNFNPVTHTGGNASTVAPVFLEKKDWTADANSWDTRSGAQNRPPSNLIDNNLTNTWHPCISGCTPPTNYPNTAVPDRTFVITIDTRGATDAKGFTLVQRHDSNTNHAKKITVEVGNSIDAFSSLGVFDLEYGSTAVGKEQVIYFDAEARTIRNFRYIRFKINKSDVNGDASGNAALNELGLFK